MSHLCGLTLLGLLVATLIVANVTKEENADQKALVPFSKSDKLLGRGLNINDVVIQLKNRGGGNMKLKLGRHGVLIPVEPLRSSPLIPSLTNTSSKNTGAVSVRFIQPNGTVNVQGSPSDNVNRRNNKNASIAESSQQQYSTNTTTQVLGNGQDNITLSGKDAADFYDSISQTGIKHKGGNSSGDTVVRIEINREDFENISQRPKSLNDFKSILKKAIEGKQINNNTYNIRVKNFANINNNTINSNGKQSNKNSQTSNSNHHLNDSVNSIKWIERQKLILAKKAAALSKMAKLASKNLIEIKRLEQEAIRQQRLLIDGGANQQETASTKEGRNDTLGSFENPSLETQLNYTTEIKAIANEVKSNASDVQEVFVKPPSSYSALQINITQSSLGTGARALSESSYSAAKTLVESPQTNSSNPQVVAENSDNTGRNQNAAPPDIVPLTTTTTTTPPPLPPPPPAKPTQTPTTTTTGIVPITTPAPARQTPPKAQKMTAGNDLSPIQSDVLENNLKVLSDFENPSNSSTSLSFTNRTVNSSSPIAETQPLTPSEPSIHVNNLNLSSNVAEYNGSPPNAFPQTSLSIQPSISSKDEMMVGDSQPVSQFEPQQLPMTDSTGVPSSETGGGTGNQQAKKKHKIKILILNGDEDVPKNLRSDKSLHLIDTDTDLDKQTEFKKELCNGDGYIRCLEKSAFEEQPTQTNSLSDESPHSQNANQQAQYRSFDNKYHEYTNDLDNEASRRDYYDSEHDPSLEDDSDLGRSSLASDEETEAQNMEFAIQSAAADAARNNRLRSYAHEQAFLNDPSNSDGDRRKSVEDLSYKRNRNLHWKKMKAKIAKVH